MQKWRHKVYRSSPAPFSRGSLVLRPSDLFNLPETWQIFTNIPCAVTFLDNAPVKAATEPIASFNGTCLPKGRILSALFALLLQKFSYFSELCSEFSPKTFLKLSGYNSKRLPLQKSKGFSLAILGLNLDTSKRGLSHGGLRSLSAICAQLCTFVAFWARF